jgi:hypothetical protein
MLAHRVGCATITTLMLSPRSGRMMLARLLQWREHDKCKCESGFSRTAESVARLSFASLPACTVKVYPDLVLIRVCSSVDAGVCAASGALKTNMADNAAALIFTIAFPNPIFTDLQLPAMHDRREPLQAPARIRGRAAAWIAGRCTGCGGSRSSSTTRPAPRVRGPWLPSGRRVRR